MNNHPPLPPNNQGIRLPNGTIVVEKLHASRGGKCISSGDARSSHCDVSEWWRSGSQLASSGAAEASKEIPLIRHMYAMGQIQHQSEGHSQVKRPVGNHRAEPEIKGRDLFNLVLFRVIRPKAYIDKVRMFVHNRNPVDNPYSPS